MLSQYDAAIQTSAGNNDAYVLSVSDATATGYQVSTSSADGSETFSINRTGGVVTRTCAPAGPGCVHGSW